MALLNPANFPDSPSFPNPWLFSGGGLGAGLALGIGLAMWLELRDQSIRTEADAEAALELPLLAAVPWVGVVATDNGTASSSSGTETRVRMNRRTRLKFKRRWLRNDYVQRVLRTTGESVQRQSRPALSVSDAAHGGGAGVPDLRNPEPQGLCAC